MRITNVLLAAVMLLATGAGTAALAADPKVFTVPVDDSFHENEMKWTGGVGTSYVYRYNLIDREGTLALCGAGYFTSPHSSRQTRSLMRKGTLRINDQVVLKDLSYFSKVKRLEDLDGAQANCMLTNAKTPRSRITWGIDMGGRARF